jgi:hypothetical protein
MNKLPRYNISIDPALSEGQKLCMDMVAYTDSPAIITKGVAFSSSKLKFTDVLKGRVAAPVLIPDMPIYRNDGSNEYEVVFSKEVIEQLYEDFMLNKGKSIFNLDHVSNDIAPSFILESWITTTPKQDKSFTKYGIEVPEGSLFFVSQFTDLEYFKREIVEKDRAAYSVEGFLGMTLKSINKMNKNEKFVEANTADGVLKTEGEMFVVGATATFVGADGTETPANGEYTIENGMVIKCENGIITEVVEAAEEALDQASIEVIEQAMSAKLAAMQLDFDNKLAALEVKFSNQPAGEAPKKTDAQPIQMSSIEKVKQLLLTKKTNK